MNFTLIHQGKREDLDQSEYTQQLYVTVLGYFFLNQPLMIRVGLLYTLYLLYETQPTNPKVKIVVSIPVWQQILKLYEDIKLHRLRDAYKVYRVMRESQAWCFSAILKHVITGPPAARPKTAELGADVGTDSLSTIIEFDKLEAISNAYNQAKTAHLDMVNSQDISHIVNREMVSMVLPPSTAPFTVVPSNFVESVKEFVNAQDQVRRFSLPYPSNQYQQQSNQYQPQAFPAQQSYPSYEVPE
jgi:hypothetical protein